MSLLRFIPELPLLRRELTELSNRRRTYVIRFLGAIVILSVVMVLFQQAVEFISGGGYAAFQRAPTLNPYNNPNQFFGSGGQIFQSIVPTLFRCVQFLMPAMICGSISLEKERNTLGTLFVTRLTPMTIVFEKLGSRLVPMFTFLLLTFPVLAFVYSLGGVDTVLLVSTLWLLFCECLLYASIGLMCSSFFATTVTAFIWSYVLTGLFVLAAEGTGMPVLGPYNVWRTQLMGFMGAVGWATFSTGLGFAPPSVTRGGMSDPDPEWLRLIKATAGIVMMSIPSMLGAGFCLVMARVFLFRRAFVSSSSVLLKLFKRVDGFFVSINNTPLTRGIVLVKDSSSLPLFDPVAWRERTKKSLGKARYLIRVLVVMEGPILLICLIAASSMQSSSFSGLRGLLYFAWGLSALMLSVKASTLLSSERTRETLDALMSTPLTLKEILTQKIAGTRRLMFVLAIPVLTVNFTLMMMHVDADSIFRRGNYGTLLNVTIYAVFAGATAFVIMHQIAWLSLLMGLKSKSQTRCVMTAMAVIVGWVVLSQSFFWPGGPVHSVFAGVDRAETFERYDYYGAFSNLRPEDMTAYTTGGTILCLLRYDGAIVGTESVLAAIYGPRNGDAPLMSMLSVAGPVAASVAAFVILLWHTFLMLSLRWIVLSLAPWLLGRRDQSAAVSTREVMEPPSTLLAEAGA